MPNTTKNPVAAEEDAEEPGGSASLSRTDAQSADMMRDADKAKVDQEMKQAAFGEAELDEDDEVVSQRMKAKWGGILHPDMPSRGAYDLGQLLIMLYLGYLLPVRLAFTKTANGTFEVALDLIIDASVWVDMFLQMRMCSYDSKTKKLISDQRKIKRDYMRSWFIVDFFSVVPADQVLLLIGTIMVENAESMGSNPEWGIYLLDLSVTARLMRLLRLVRLAKIKQLLNLDRLTHTVYMLVKGLDVTKLQVAFWFRIIMLHMIIIAAGHFLGCIWLMIGRTNVLLQQNPSGWMVNAYAQDTVNMTKNFIRCSGKGFDSVKWNEEHGSNCTAIALERGQSPFKCDPIPAEAPFDVDCSWIMSREETLGGTGADDGVGASEGEQYLSAFYFALVTVTTVGYGDILPASQGEKQFVMGCIVLGAFLYAYIIGDFSNLLKNLSQDRDEFDAKMRSVNDLLAYVDAPADLRLKVQNYFDFKFGNKEGSSQLIQDLPASLQMELVGHRYGDLIARVPFFASLNDRAKVDLCQQMRSFTVAPGDFLMAKGDWHDELLILSKGSARTAEKGEDGKATLYDVGTFWGEMQFLGLEHQRTVSVVADTYCEVASLSPKNIHSSSTIHTRLGAYAEMRIDIEAKVSRGETVEMDQLQAQLEQKYSEMVDEDEPDSKPEPNNDAELKELFNELDLDNSGDLDRNEVYALLDSLGRKPSQIQLDEVMVQMDPDSSGGVDFAEFSTWWWAENAAARTSWRAQASSLDSVMEGLDELQAAQRRTDAQLALISKQLKELLGRGR